MEPRVSLITLGVVLLLVVEVLVAVEPDDESVDAAAVDVVVDDVEELLEPPEPRLSVL